MTDYYVSQESGNNLRDGKSWPKAWASLREAIVRAERGDTIHVAKGVYDPIVIKSPLTLYGYGAVIDGSENLGSTQCILVLANWTRISGLEVRNSFGGGIVSKGAHHVTVDNNYVHHNKGHGISLIKGDYFTVTGNKVCHNVGVNGRYATSGISVFNPRASDHNDIPYRIKILGNTSYCNDYDGKTDGFGILFDKFTRYSPHPYHHKALIRWNRLYMNGNCGIYVYQSDNALISDNWCWHNAQSNRKSYPAEIGLNGAVGVTINNNIAESLPNRFVFVSGGPIPNRASFSNNRLFVCGKPDQAFVCDTFKHWNHDLPLPEDNTLGGAPPLWWNRYWAIQSSRS